MKTNKIFPKVTLVGAGPGDPELITLKGVRALERADVVFYDALVNRQLLAYTPKNCQHIYVGKRFDKHEYSQDKINKMLVDYAQNYGHVVRLKGGDPFIFGRGSEEIDFVESFSIPTEVIPGISSALAVPASQGIPLTKRHVSSSFWVTTGSTKNREFSEDLILASQSSATLVILMGLRNFLPIVKLVQKHRSANTPIAIIQNGTLPNERIYSTVLQTAESIFEEAYLEDPSIIVIGNVVAENPGFFEEEIQRVLFDCSCNI